jgi:hypothetical protein
MKYRLIAKAFMFVKGTQRDIEAGDAPWLTGGEKKKFTTKQLDKLNTMLTDMVEKAQDKLISQGVDFEAMFKFLPSDNPTPAPAEESDEEEDEEEDDE